MRGLKAKVLRKMAYPLDIPFRKNREYQRDEKSHMIINNPYTPRAYYQTVKRVYLGLRFPKDRYLFTRAVMQHIVSARKAGISPAITLQKGGGHEDSNISKGQ